MVIELVPYLSFPLLLDSQCPYLLSNGTRFSDCESCSPVVACVFSFLSNSGSWYCSSTSLTWSICNQDSAQIRASLRIFCSLSHLLGDYLEDTQHHVCTHHQPASALVLNFLAFLPRPWFSEEGWSSLGLKILFRLVAGLQRSIRCFYLWNSQIIRKFLSKTPNTSNYYFTSHWTFYLRENVMRTKEIYHIPKK